MNKEYKRFLSRVSDYLFNEYNWGKQETLSLTKDEQYAISIMLKAHYESNDSINNSANDVISFIRLNTEWMETNL